MKEHANGASYHNRYPYSGKIICGQHGTTYHRRILSSAKGDKEIRECKIYRTKGKAGCAAPQVRSEEPDAIMARIFTEMMKDKDAIINALLFILQSVPQEVDYAKARQRVEEDMAAIHAKKDRLLDLNMDGVISNAEFKKRNDAFNDQLGALESQLVTIQAEEQRQREFTLDADKIRRVLEKELSFEDGINSNLVATILERSSSGRKAPERRSIWIFSSSWAPGSRRCMTRKILPPASTLQEILLIPTRPGGPDLHGRHWAGQRHFHL